MGLDNTTDKLRVIMYGNESQHDLIRYAYYTANRYDIIDIIELCDAFEETKSKAELYTYRTYRLRLVPDYLYELIDFVQGFCASSEMQPHSNTTIKRRIGELRKFNEFIKFARKYKKMSNSELFTFLHISNNK